MITIRRTFAFVIIFLFCFLTCSCSKNYDATNTSNMVSTGNMISKRSFLHRNGLIITALPIKNENTKSSISNHTYSSEITQPNIVGLKNAQIQAAINKEISDYISSIISKFELALKNSDPSGIAVNNKLTISSTTYANHNNVLCLLIDHYMEFNNETDGDIKAFRYNLNTGHHIELNDLFEKGSNYKEAIEKSLNMDICSYNLDGVVSNKQHIDIDSSFDFYFDTHSITFMYDINQLPAYLHNSESKGKKWNLLRDWNANWNPARYIFFPGLNGSMISFPFSRLQNKIEIFDKYFNPDTNIYNYGDLEKEFISDYIDFDYSIKEKIYKGRTFKAYYFEMNDTNSPLNERINSIIQKEVQDFFDDESMRKISRAPTDYEGCDYELRIRLESCGNYLSLVKNVGSSNIIARNLNAVSWCFDIRTGNEIKLKDLFKEGYDYKSEINRILKEIHFKDDSQFKQFDKTKNFSFYIENSLVICFTNNEGLNIGYFVDFGEFPTDKLKVYE